MSSFDSLLFSGISDTPLKMRHLILFNSQTLAMEADSQSAANAPSFCSFLLYLGQRSWSALTIVPIRSLSEILLKSTHEILRFVFRSFLKRTEGVPNLWMTSY